MAVNPLFRMAVRAGGTAAVRHWLQRGEDVNFRDDKGMSPLMHAAARGHLEICRLLLEAGADPALLDSEGQDALHLARANGRQEVETMLWGLMNNTAASPNGQAGGAGIKDGGGRYGLGEQFSSDEDRLDLSAWEEDVASPLPPEDPSCLAAAEALHRRLSLHIPISTDADWSDIDIDLPEITAGVGRGKSALDLNRWDIARQLILMGIQTGRISRQQIDAAMDYDETPDFNFTGCLLIVLGDLGIHVDDDGLVTDPWDPETLQAGSSDSDPYGTDDESVEEAMDFLRVLTGQGNDPLSIVRKKGVSWIGKRTVDRELVLMVQEGDKKSFDVLVGKYQYKIIMLISRYLHDPNEALDLSQ